MLVVFTWIRLGQDSAQLIRGEWTSAKLFRPHELHQLGWIGIHEVLCPGLVESGPHDLDRHVATAPRQLAGQLITERLEVCRREVEEVLISFGADEAQELRNHRLVPLVRVGTRLHLFPGEPVLQKGSGSCRPQLLRISDEVYRLNDFSCTNLRQSSHSPRQGGLLPLLDYLAGFCTVSLLCRFLSTLTTRKRKAPTPKWTFWISSDRCHGVSSTSHSGRSERPMYTALIAFSNTGQSESHQSVAWVIQ